MVVGRVVDWRDMASFEEQTNDTIKSCARYLNEHADELAKRFCGGAKSWAIELRAGDDGMFPWVEILTHVNKGEAIVASGDVVLSYGQKYAKAK